MRLALLAPLFVLACGGSSVDDPTDTGTLPDTGETEDSGEPVDSGDSGAEDSDETDSVDSAETDTEDSDDSGDTGDTDTDDSGETDSADSAETDTDDSGETDSADSGGTDTGETDTDETDTDDSGETDTDDSGGTDTGETDTDETDTDDSDDTDESDTDDTSPPVDLPPTAPAIRILPNAPATLDDLTLDVLTPSVDPEGLEVTYGIRWRRGTLEQTGLADGTTVPAALTSRGETWSVTVTARDPAGNEASPVEASTTIVNSPPTATVSLPTAPTVDEPLVATLQGSDPDGDPVSFTTRWQADGVPLPGFNDREQIDADALAPGQTWTVFVTPDDGDLAGPTVQATTTLIDRPPVVTSVTLSPAQPKITDTVSALVEAFDPDGTAVSLAYRWQVNDQEVSEAHTATLPAGTATRGQAIRVNVTATSGSLSSEPFPSGAVTVVNSPPVFGGARVDPAEPTVTSGLRCDAVDPFDADRDPVTIITTRWSVNGVDVGTSAPTTTLRAGQLVRCTLTPFDGEEAGEAVTSPPVEILNTPGLLNDVIVTPSAPRSTETLTCAAGTWFDPDPDDPVPSFTFTWLDEEEAVIHEGSTLPASLTTRGDVVRCRAQPDGQTTGSATSAPITIRNGIPALGSVSIEPFAPTALTPLIASAQGAVDPDDDPLTLDWTWTDAQGVVLGVDAVLAPGAYKRDDVITLTGVARDDEDASPPASTSVTIRNAPPAAVTPSLVPEAPVRHADDLVCVLPPDAPSTDADDEPVTYQVEWSTDGVNYTDPSLMPNPVRFSSTFQPNDTTNRSWHLPGTTTFCRFVASDGTARVEGPAAQATWVDGPLLFFVDTTDDSPQASGAPTAECVDALGRCSLRAAFTAADQAPEGFAPLGSRILLQPGARYALTLPAPSSDLQDGSGGTLVARRPVEVVGDAEDPPTIVPTSGGIYMNTSNPLPGWGLRLAHLRFEDAPGRVLFIDRGINLDLDDVTFEDCAYPIQMNDGGRVSAKDVSIEGDQGTGDYAIFLNQSVHGTFDRLTITGRGDTANPAGNAPLTLINPGKVEIFDGWFENNAAFSGGHISFRATPETSELHLVDTTLREGRAGSVGGAIDMGLGGKLFLTDVVIEDHTAGSGGGLYKGNDNFPGEVHLIRTTVQRNTSTGAFPFAGSGGGLYLHNALLVLQQADIRDNGITSADSAAFGGGLYLLDVTVLAEDSVVTGNTVPAVGQAGGVFRGGTTTLSPNLSVTGNTPDDIVP